MSTIARAEALFERFVGYKIRLSTYAIVIPNDPRGAKIPDDKVVEIHKVRAMASEWMFDKYFGNTGWTDIDSDHMVIHHHDGFYYISVHPTLFGTDYDRIEVTYTAGHVKLPDDMISAILEMQRLIEEDIINEWNCILPAHIVDVVDKYRKEMID